MKCPNREELYQLFEKQFSLLGPLDLPSVSDRLIEMSNEFGMSATEVSIAFVEWTDAQTLRALQALLDSRPSLASKAPQTFQVLRELQHRVGGKTDAG